MIEFDEKWLEEISLTKTQVYNSFLEQSHR